MLISRALYENLLRKNVRERCKNVRFIPGVVTGLNPAKNDRSRIGSVDVKMKDEGGVVQGVQSIEAVLFVGTFLHNFLLTFVLLTCVIQTALVQRITD